MNDPTELLYQTDSFLREFDAEVVAVSTNPSSVALDRTVFYPGGGGQPHDLGELRYAGQVSPVSKVFRQETSVWHHVDRAPPVGSRVHGVLDWQRRYRLMRTHTAMHILCAVVWLNYGAQVTGGDMAPLTGRLDFELPSLDRKLVSEIEEKINAEVQAAREVVTRLLPRAEALQIPDLIRTKVNLLPVDLDRIRTVEIVGLDLQADGGTHVANTREVGSIRIVGHKSKGRLNKRIRIALGEGSP